MARRRRGTDHTTKSLSPERRRELATSLDPMVAVSGGIRAR